MEKLILVRHGETHWNASGLSQGHKDVPLSANGERQVDLLRAALEKRMGTAPFDCAFASPLRRAQQTARLLGAEPVVLDDLIEIDRGHWEGHDPGEIKRRWGKLQKQWYDDPAGLGMPGGEAFDDLWERAGRLLVRLCEAEGTVLACAHKALNRVLIARMLGRPSKGVWQISQPQSACTVLVRVLAPSADSDASANLDASADWSAERVGDVSHLPPELRSDS